MLHFGILSKIRDSSIPILLEIESLQEGNHDD